MSKRDMVALINQHVREMKVELKKAQEEYEEYDCVEAMHEIHNIGYALEQFAILKRKVRDSK